jgi:epoxyqueuosine reductase
LDACPTGAFAAPFVLDPRRCIAYLTIELHEPPPPELREAVGEHLFGCDACQEVCPFNRGAATAAEAPAPFRPLPRWGQLDLEKLTTLDEAGWRSASEGTPLRRAGRVGVARAAALVAAARLRAGAVGAEADVARRALSAAAAHDDPSVREVAAWAGEGTGKPE